MPPFALALAEEGVRDEVEEDVAEEVVSTTAAPWKVAVACCASVFQAGLEEEGVAAASLEEVVSWA